MKFLFKEGFSNDLICQMQSRYDDAVLYQFSLDEENVCDVIHYFKKIGIECIDWLLLTRIEIFMRDINEVKDSFLRHNIKQVVDEINKDINVIDVI